MGVSHPGWRTRTDRRVWGPVILLWLIAAGCGGSSGGAKSNEALEGLGPDLIDVEGTAELDATDRRPELLATLGPPESFILTADEVGGRVVRFESWQYWSSLTQIDLVDGEIAWNAQLEAIPDGSFLPLIYAPDEFVLQSSVDEVKLALGDVTLTPIDGAADDLGVDGAELWAGEQLLLGFVDDQLIHVQTFPLAPEEL